MYIYRDAKKRTRKTVIGSRSRDQVKREMEQIQICIKIVVSAVMIGLLPTRFSPESKMDTDETSRTTGRFNVDSEAREQINTDLEPWTKGLQASQLRLSMRDLQTRQTRPLMFPHVTLPDLTPASDSESTAGFSRLREHQNWLQPRSTQNATPSETPQPWRVLQVRGALIVKYSKIRTGSYKKHSRTDTVLHRGPGKWILKTLPRLIT